MIRLSDIQKEEIKNKIIQNKSLNTIFKEMNLNKTTVYYHFRKIKGRTNVHIQINESNKELVGEFMGLFAGDGSYYYDKKSFCHKIRFHFCQREAFFVDELDNNLFKILFNRIPNRYLRDYNRLDLAYTSKEMFQFIKKYVTWEPHIRKTYTVQLKPKNYSKKFKIGFVRGSVDSDGHISKNRIMFASVSYNLMINVANFLKDLKLDHNLHKYVDKRPNRKDIYHINIPATEHKKFLKIIKPRNVK